VASGQWPVGAIAANTHRQATTS